jgi:hypothetical protein
MRYVRLLTGLIILEICSVSSYGEAPACPAANLPEEFRIELIRLGKDQVLDKGKKVERTYGDIGVNGQNVGRFYENPERAIPAGVYRGELRYNSDHNFVQSQCGAISRKGDFLLEVAGVTMTDGRARTNILFHPGALPSHSDGCVLFGARRFDANGVPLPLPDDYPLVRVRRAFYGTDDPISCPNKRIVINIKK